MKNNYCKLCSDFNFKKVQIAELMGRTEIAFSGNLNQVNEEKRFNFCPACGRKLTDEDYKKEGET